MLYSATDHFRVDVLERYGEVYEEQVQVVQLQVAQYALQGRSDVLSRMIRAPQLAGDEQLLPLDQPTAHRLLESLASLPLIAVVAG